MLKVQKFSRFSLKQFAVLTITALWNFYKNYRQIGWTRQPESPLAVVASIKYFVF